MKGVSGDEMSIAVIYGSCGVFVNVAEFDVKQVNFGTDVVIMSNGIMLFPNAFTNKQYKSHSQKVEKQGEKLLRSRALHPFGYAIPNTQKNMGFGGLGIHPFPTYPNRGAKWVYTQNDN